MSNGDSESRDEKLFKVALDARNFEISLFWQRSNYFLVLNSALAVGFFSLQGQGYALVLAGLGAIASLLWFLVNLGSKYWQSRWEHELILREQKVYPNDPLFAAKRAQTDQYVRRSLRWNDHGAFHRLVDRMVLLKPSVSLMMTVLSVVFFVTWVGLLLQRSHLLFDVPWIRPGSMTLSEFATSVLSSLIAIAVLYLLYMVSAVYAKRCVAKAECWWLPGAGTFRFVIRNIPRTSNLFDVRYRSWLRKVVQASDTMSVSTFVDTDVIQGERLLLPGRQDQPVICFRLEADGQGLRFIVTDKMGNAEGSWLIDDESVSLMVEFSVRARMWFLFKHEISRLYSIPQYRTLRGERCNVFREYLLPMQRSAEQQMKSVLQFADEVTVTI